MLCSIHAERKDACRQTTTIADELQQKYVASLQGSELVLGQERQVAGAQVCSSLSGQELHEEGHQEEHGNQGLVCQFCEQLSCTRHIQTS